MYLKKIDQMVSQNQEKNANRSVLDKPLFVLLVGKLDAQRQATIHEELSKRWQSTRKYIHLFNIDLSADMTKIEISERDNMREIFCNIKSGTADNTIKMQLSWWFYQRVGKFARSLGSLNGSHICVVCQGESAQLLDQRDGCIGVQP